MLTLLALCVLGGSAVGLLNSMFGVGGAFIVIPLLDEILQRLPCEGGLVLRYRPYDTRSPRQGFCLGLGGV